jgi:uncharacterized protein (DUF1697 family)
MQTYISFIRGINIGGNKKVSMELLKEVYSSLGLSNVKTFGQSGNVVFEYSEGKSEILSKKIEDKLKKDIGFEVSVLIRTKEELKKAIESNPFSAISKEELSKVCVAFLSDIPSKDNLGEIEKIKDSSEKFVIAGKEIYLFFQKGYGRTKLTNNFFEKKLKVKSTTRTVNVIKKLVDIA